MRELNWIVHRPLNFGSAVRQRGTSERARRRGEGWGGPSAGRTRLVASFAASASLTRTTEVVLNDLLAAVEKRRVERRDILVCVSAWV